MYILRWLNIEKYVRASNSLYSKKVSNDQELIQSDPKYFGFEGRMWDLIVSVPDQFLRR